jgi:hypothetical protein
VTNTPDVSACHHPSPPSRPAALHQQAQRDPQTKHALAGAGSLRDSRPQARRGWAGCGIPSTPPRATTRLLACKVITGCQASKGTTTPHYAITRADTEQHPTLVDGRSRRSATTDPGSGRRAPTTSIATSTATDGRERPWARTEGVLPVSGTKPGLRGHLQAVLPFRSGFANGGRRDLMATDSGRTQDRP